MGINKVREHTEQQFEIDIKYRSGRKFRVLITEQDGRDEFNLFYYNIGNTAISVGTFGVAAWDEFIACLEEVRDHSKEAEKMEKIPGEEVPEKNMTQDFIKSVTEFLVENGRDFRHCPVHYEEVCPARVMSYAEEEPDFLSKFMKESNEDGSCEKCIENYLNGQNDAFYYDFIRSQT